MGEEAKLIVQQGHSMAADEREAVADLRRQIIADDQVLLLFCSSAYNLDRLASHLRATFSMPIIGCTTAGQLNATGFQNGGISAVSLGGDLTASPYLIDLDHWERDLLTLSSEVAAMKRANAQSRCFGLLLIDGLAQVEERLVAQLYRYLPQIPIVGGSAGDDLKFKRTSVFARGQFRSRCAVFTLFHTSLPFTTLKFEHFRATDQVLVVTKSAPDRRTIHELNGEPAADVYARTLGLTVDELSPQVFSCHPFVLELGDEIFPRSVQEIQSDGSMVLYCAIDNGVVLSLGRPVDPVGAATAAFQGLRLKVGQPSLVLGFDCVLRRLELEQAGLLDSMGQVFTTNRVVGFCTYGEQYEGLHVNQTFTGIAIGDTA